MGHTTLDVDETSMYKREVDELFLLIEDEQTMTQMGEELSGRLRLPWILFKKILIQTRQRVMGRLRGVVYNCFSPSLFLLSG